MSHIRADCLFFYLALLTPQSFAGGCFEDIDCSLNGVCIENQCSCDPAWRGSKCQSFNFLPVRQGWGYRWTEPPFNTSSWGSAVSYDKQSKNYYAWVTELSDHCGMNTWKTNTRIVRAVSATPFGPYLKEEVQVPVRSDGLQIARGPKGEFVAYYSADVPSPREECKHCFDGSTPEICLKERKKGTTHATTPKASLKQDLFSLGGIPTYSKGDAAAHSLIGAIGASVRASQKVATRAARLSTAALGTSLPRKNKTIVAAANTSSELDAANGTSMESQDPITLPSLPHHHREASTQQQWVSKWHRKGWLGRRHLLQEETSELISDPVDDDVMAGPRRRLLRKNTSPTYMSWAPSPKGPWTAPQMIHPLSKLPHADLNVAAVVNGDGTVVGLWRGHNEFSGVSEPYRFNATNFKDPHTYLFTEEKVFDVEGGLDDMFMWRDHRGHYHVLMQQTSDCATCGGHGFSVDGRDWEYSGVAYDNVVLFDGNNKKTLSHMGSPHLVFDAETGTIPIALTNGVHLDKSGEASQDRWRQRGYVSDDQSFTLLRPLAQAPPPKDAIPAHSVASPPAGARMEEPSLVSPMLNGSMPKKQQWMAKAQEIVAGRRAAAQAAAQGSDIYQQAETAAMVARQVHAGQVAAAAVAAEGGSPEAQAHAAAQAAQAMAAFQTHTMQK
ncbi:hypothetical protein CYMTET_6900 [Cymbomonas tetramitiformis]|uniref:EGF-like domain-containing protein n=1 Tax=Cymbomonas tetramitiformis TaxID=36881 RepID=A0AAE0GWN8_9CHLO|nr:hypothetical protein CYMTET_6900 [Cymbomonas tetramitiformis]